MARVALSLALALLLVTAGCSAGYRGPVTDGAGDDTPVGTETPTDRLGWEGGYASDDPLPVTTEDGLNESELEAVVARTMARIELVRGLEFEDRVPVEVISRAEYRNRSVSFGGGDDPVTDALYEALLLVGEDRTAGAAFETVFAEGVVGYYSPGADRIVLVSDAPTPRVDRRTLAHELVHALQDQRLPRVPRGQSRDERLARLGLTEGDAVVVAGEYERRCGTEWSCLPRPERSGGSAGAIARNPGVYLTVVQPYVSGPGFVRALRERGGWEAVNDAYRDPPASTEQTIRPERYPGDRPANVTVPERASPGWERVGTETAGEAAISVTFWANGQGNREDDSISTDYRNPRSTGWAGDRLVAYTNGSHTAHVWVSEWENETDARQFARSYRAVLIVRHGARIDGPVLVVPDGPFADAYRITREGTRVTVVSAPTGAALSEVAG